MYVVWLPKLKRKGAPLPSLSMFPFACLFLILLHGSIAAPATEIDRSRTVITRIAPDLSIITEVSIEDPCVGQQFSIMYRLRAVHPPAAVDIDPQQYPGFWTIVIPVSQDSPSAARPVKSGTGVDYLLRQVVAFPLEEGMLKLPPLSLKIKRPGRAAAQQVDWDVKGQADPVAITALPLSSGLPGDNRVPLVGTVTGEMRRAEGSPSGMLLEIQGTANLALFHPLDWLVPKAGTRYRAILENEEQMPRTVDRDGKRQLSLVQRQQWRISVFPADASLQVGDLVLPVFEPVEQSWKQTVIPGLGSTQGNRPAADETPSKAPATVVDQGVSRSRLMAISFGIVVLAGLSAILFWVIRWITKIHPGGEITDISLEVLQKQLRASPRIFLDGAHNLLEKFAETQNRRHDLGAGETPLDQCWLSVQRYRFTREPLPAAKRTEIFAAIRQVLVSGPAATSDAFQGKVRHVDGP